MQINDKRRKYKRILDVEVTDELINSVNLALRNSMQRRAHRILVELMFEPNSKLQQLSKKLRIPVSTTYDILEKIKKIIKEKDNGEE